MNKKVIFAGVIILASGIVRNIGHKPLTPIFIGGYVFIIVLAALDGIGGPIAQIAGGLAMVAVVYVLLSPQTSPFPLLAGLLGGGSKGGSSSTAKKG